MPNGVNYRLEHVETAKILDPTNVEKLIKVEPWSVNESNSGQTIPHEEEDTQPEISQSHRNPQFENGSFIVYEKLGDLFDDDIRIMIEELHHRRRKRTRKDTPLMLGGRADRYLHTPASEQRPCS